MEMRPLNRKLELSPRLQAVAELVPKGARLADVGTDHAYLPVSLLLSGTIPGAIACDLRAGPLDRARRTAERYGCTDQMSFRLCDGLSGISSSEADVIVIAGMGGETIADILCAAKWVKVKHLTVILQPMSKQPQLRRWLWQNGFAIRSERLAVEERAFYNIIQASAGDTAPLTPAQEWAGLLGPDTAQELCAAYVGRLIGKVDRMLAGLALAQKSAPERSAGLREVRRGLLEMKREWEL